MTKWTIKPSYKHDLACFCNLFTQNNLYISNHPEAYSYFKEKISSHPEFVGLAQGLFAQNIIPSTAITSIFDTTDYDDFNIDRLCSVVDDDNLRQTVLWEYLVGNNLITQEQWDAFQPIFPLLSSMIKYAHHIGFQVYWEEKCRDEILKVCNKFASEAHNYPVIERVNSILDDETRHIHDDITLYLCKFSSPHGTSLKNRAFISDIRWNLTDTVEIALHEMLHPPFSREKIANITMKIKEDSFFKKAKEMQFLSYPTNESFLEENIVEGAHIYLAECIGTRKDGLQYFIDHDGGTHIVSVIVYDALKNGALERFKDIGQVVEGLINDGSLAPGNIFKSYDAIYKKNNMGDKHPFQNYRP